MFGLAYATRVTTLSNKFDSVSLDFIVLNSVIFRGQKYHLYMPKLFNSALSGQYFTARRNSTLIAGGIVNSTEHLGGHFTLSEQEWVKVF